MELQLRIRRHSEEPAPAYLPLVPDADAPQRIVVFTARLSISVQMGILDLTRSHPQVHWLILLYAPRRRIRTLLRNQARNLWVNGWRWIPYQAAEICRMVCSRLGPTASETPLDRDWRAFLAGPQARILSVENMHDAVSLGYVKDFCPDLGISLAAPIMQRKLFALPRLGTVNLHKGRVPDYRGAPPAFWELWNDEPSVGCTVHWVDDKLDTGDVVATDRVDRGSYSSLAGLQLRLDQVGIELTRRAVADILTGRASKQPQAPSGRTYRKPTLSQSKRLRQRLDVMRPSPAKPRVLRTMQNGAFALAWAAYRYGLRSLLAARITVLLYHRVTDDVRDNLSVGIEQFDRQMAFLRRCCRVLSIEEVLDTATLQPSRAPQVAVTFDDGYLDNYTNAVPILLRHGIPAGFFVATGIVGSNRRFPHDIKRGNPPLSTMNWDQLREMRARGFTIGSHSVHHIDCATEPEEIVVAELTESRDTLQHELGVKHPVFAYPYGGRQHMSPERLLRVKQCGYAGCFSAYGGSNIGSVDRFNVLRRAIQWEFSDEAFRMECLGLR